MDLETAESPQDFAARAGLAADWADAIPNEYIFVLNELPARPGAGRHRTGGHMLNEHGSTRASWTTRRSSTSRPT